MRTYNLHNNNFDYGFVNRRSDTRTINDRNRLERKNINDIHNYYAKIIMFTLLIFCISIVLFFIALSKPAKAEDINSVQYKYFHVITVEKGDSLWSLAEKSGYTNNRNDFKKEVMNINHLNNDQINEGQKIVIPYYSYEFKM